MSERMTVAFLPGIEGAGLAHYGRKTVGEAITALRAHAAHIKAGADAVLAASDSDFRVETYVGVHVQKNREILQEGRQMESNHE